jgi:hypothetical protein
MNEIIELADGAGRTRTPLDCVFYQSRRSHLIASARRGLAECFLSVARRLVCIKGDRIVALSRTRPPACGATAKHVGSAIRLGEGLRDDSIGLKVICRSPGDGVLAYDDRPLVRASAPCSS